MERCGQELQFSYCSCHPNLLSSSVIQIRIFNRHGHKQTVYYQFPVTIAMDKTTNSLRIYFVCHCCRMLMRNDDRLIFSVRGSGTRRKWQWRPRRERWDPACRMLTRVSIVTRRERQGRDIWPKIVLLCRLSVTWNGKNENITITNHLKEREWMNGNIKKPPTMCSVVDAKQKKLTICEVFISVSIDFNLRR